ncbi:MAG: PAS domain-containing protein [Rothia sp. (in: high G+C Gram-positive bacteria)]|nr:PAS domain-containing protein [Rothia sp. (in: high G+C Gram-positive bacteria)]
MNAPVNPSSSFLAQYIPLVDFLGQSMGSNVEVVLHDLDVPDKSIIAISNSHISGRQIGGPVTDFALWFMQQGDTTQVPTMTGYRAINAEGRVCRSSSYFLRDESNVMRGMLCINVDVSDWIQIRNLTAQMIGTTETTAQSKTQAFGDYPGAESLPLHDAATETILPPNIQSFIQQSSIQTPLLVSAVYEKPVPTDEEAVVKSLRSNVQTLLKSMLDKAIAERDVTPDRMQRDERVQVVHDLEETGFFLLKGGIAAAAKRLGVSEPTIYRYLVEVRS